MHCSSFSCDSKTPCPEGCKCPSSSGRSTDVPTRLVNEEEIFPFPMAEIPDGRGGREAGWVMIVLTVARATPRSGRIRFIPRRQLLTIGAKGQASQRCGRCPEGREFFAEGDIPGPKRAIRADGDQAGVVRVKARLRISAPRRWRVWAKAPVSRSQNGQRLLGTCRGDPPRSEVQGDGRHVGDLQSKRPGSAAGVPLPGGHDAAGITDVDLLVIGAVDKADDVAPGLGTHAAEGRPRRPRSGSNRRRRRRPGFSRPG